MSDLFFNYATYVANRGWDRRKFFQQWQRIYTSDPRWVAPHYRHRRMLLQPERDPYLSRCVTAFIHLEALPRRQQMGGLGGVLWEQSVAAAVLCVDPTARHKIGRLALLHCANDEESLERIVAAAQEELWQQGGRQLLGPTGLSPQLQRGVLTNYFHVTPPLHTPYNPPYLPELMSTTLAASQHTVLLQHDLRAATDRLRAATDRPDSAGKRDEQRPAPPTAVEIVPLTAALACSEPFLPLWKAATSAEADGPSPDSAEVAFLWKWLTVWPWMGWVAVAGGEPIGFVLLQPDLAEQSRFAKGGQNPLWALWLWWRQRLGVNQGRMVVGAVVPQWRQRGVGTALWLRAIEHARQQAWATLSIGPLPEQGIGSSFLQRRGAKCQQRYTLYASEL